MNESWSHRGDGEAKETVFRIVHLEDDPLDAELVRHTLRTEFPGCSIVAVDSRMDFLAALIPDPPDIILSDFTLPHFGGLDALTLTRECAPRVPFVFLSGTIGEERAIAALRAGATDYVHKDNVARLPIVIRRALDDSAQSRIRERSERRLRELIEIIERADEAIVVSDLDGCVTLWNDGAARLYGLPATVTLGRNSNEIFSGTELAHVRDAREATLETGDWRRELNVATRDGRTIVVDVHMTLVRDAAGRPCARLTIATDITEKRKMEEKIHRAQRLESLGLLAAGIAHDFNNVLASITLATALLRKCATAPSDIRMFELLEKSTTRGSGLTRQILDFAAGSSAKRQVSSPKQLLREIGDVIRASFPKSIVLDEIAQDGLWSIHANPMQIHQVLLNLAVNARDAMVPRGGTLRIRAENQVLDDQSALTLEGAKPGRFIVFEVSDTGSGIKPEVLARIWEPFFTTKSKEDGTGLGLSTVRGIAAAHGGFATVESKVGLGTSFRIFLPADGSGVDTPE